MRVGPDMSNNHHEFNDVEPPFAIFVLRDEGLVFSKAVGQVLLRQAGVFSGLYEAFRKPALSFAMN